MMLAKLTRYAEIVTLIVIGACFEEIVDMLKNRVCIEKA